MNIYQMRHAILAKHVGERFTPAQLKVELLEKFPSVKPQSVNAPDCFYSDRKRAGSTCPECGKLGGFAVNRDGVVDMGASGWENISPVYVPTGNTRSSMGPSAVITMSDPLVGFDWKIVCDRYHAACYGFKPHSEHLPISWRLWNRSASISCQGWHLPMHCRSARRFCISCTRTLSRFSTRWCSRRLGLGLRVPTRRYPFYVNTCLTLGHWPINTPNSFPALRSPPSGLSTWRCGSSEASCCKIAISLIDRSGLCSGCQFWCQSGLRFPASCCISLH